MPEKFKYENQQRAITSKVWCPELWFLCTALLLNEIYLPMKFHVDALHSFKVMLRTKKERTDGCPDWRVNYYMPPFGGIKINKEQLFQNYEAKINGSCTLHFSTMRSIYLLSFKSVVFIMLELHGRQKKYNKGQKLKSYEAELYFYALHIHSLRSIYIKKRFLLISFVKVMSQTPHGLTDIQTDGWTDKAATMCSHFRNKNNNSL